MVNGSVLDHVKQTLITVISMDNVLMTFTKVLSAGKRNNLASILDMFNMVTCNKNVINMINSCGSST